MAGRLKTAIALLKKLDEDPNAWPTGPGSRVYLLDCLACGSKVPPAAVQFHRRRCVASKSSSGPVATSLRPPTT